MSIENDVYCLSDKVESQRYQIEDLCSEISSMKRDITILQDQLVQTLDQFMILIKHNNVLVERFKS